MPNLTPRKYLTVDTLYVEDKTGLYFVTPDCVGCYWYDTLEEAIVEYGWNPDVPARHIWELADF